MNIVILDENTVSYGDIDFSEIDALGNTSYFQKLPEEQLIDVCRDADAILVNKTEVTRSLLFALPRLRYVGAFATGYNNIDLAACRERGVTFCNAPSYSTDAVAQHTIALLLMQAGNVNAYAASVKRGDWTQSENFSYYAYPQYEVCHKTLGIFGLGEIGGAVAKIGDALGMEILYTSRSPKDVPYRRVDRETLFTQSDYLSLHCPLTEETRGMINKDALARMKPSAVLLNTARGALVNEKDLADALNNGRLRAACLDVVAQEPMRADNPLLRAKNCIITPHVAWAARETRQRLVHVVAENLKAFLAGKPIHVIA